MKLLGTTSELNKGCLSSSRTEITSASVRVLDVVMLQLAASIQAASHDGGPGPGLAVAVSGEVESLLGVGLGM